jgi:hypothetical protein
MKENFILKKKPSTALTKENAPDPPYKIIKWVSLLLLTLFIINPCFFYFFFSLNQITLSFGIGLGGE